MDSCVAYTDLLVPVSFPYIDTGEVGHNVRPQFLVRGQLKKNGRHIWSYGAAEKKRKKRDDVFFFRGIVFLLTRKAVVNCASALSMQFTEIQ